MSARPVKAREDMQSSSQEAMQTIHFRIPFSRPIAVFVVLIIVAWSTFFNNGLEKDFVTKFRISCTTVQSFAKDGCANGVKLRRDRGKPAEVQKSAQIFSKWLRESKPKQSRCKIPDQNFPNQPTAANPILVLATTFADNSKTYRNNIQELTLESFDRLRNSIRPLIATDSARWLQAAKSWGFRVAERCPASTSGLPLVHSLLDAAETYARQIEARWFGFANGDMWFDDSLLDTLQGIYDSHLMESGNGNILLVGQRRNLPYSAGSFDLLRQKARRESLLQDASAEDYFIMTVGTLHSLDLPDYIIGRPGFDNFLVSYALASPNVTVVDVTRTVDAIHVTGDGEYSGWSPKEDKYWNYCALSLMCSTSEAYKDLCSQCKDKTFGFVSEAPLRTVRRGRTWVGLERSPGRWRAYHDPRDQKGPNVDV
eukprot:m.313470 g.313470  ORF g.313470 m.313470 type:complete len:426 (-) comp16491_c0_seq4:798-2075(-)